MKLTLNFQNAVPPLTLELPGEEEQVLGQVREAIASGSILDFTDTKGERVLVPANAIAYAMVPSPQTTAIGFGRA